MDDLQRRLAQIALDTLGDRGFVLGGGHAVELHGMSSRPSEDIDLFSNRRGDPGSVTDKVVESFENAGLAVTISRSTPDLVQMLVSDTAGRTCKVDIGVFWRAHEPVVLDVGPVLHPDDAVAGKMDALYNRWAPRDFLDVDAILISGRYDRRGLETIAHEHNPGFNREMFAQSLAYLTRTPDREFTSYGVDDHQIAAMRSRFAEWHREITTD